MSAVRRSRQSAVRSEPSQNLFWFAALGTMNELRVISERTSAAARPVRMIAVSSKSGFEAIERDEYGLARQRESGSLQDRRAYETKVMCPVLAMVLLPADSGLTTGCRRMAHQVHQPVGGRSRARSVARRVHARVWECCSVMQRTLGGEVHLTKWLNL